MSTTEQASSAESAVLVPDILHSTKVRTSPQRVFDLISTGEGWNKWFTHASEFDAVAGSPVRLVWSGWSDDGSDIVDTGEVLECEPGKRFVFTWNSPPSVVTFTVAEHPDGTWLEVVETGIPQTKAGLERFGECAAGWGEALTLVRCYAEHGIRLST